MFTNNTNKEDDIHNGSRSIDKYTSKYNMLNSPNILTGLSHEVRTYMNSIVAFSFLMNNEACDETERLEYNRHIMHSCEQLLTLFDNFLDSALLNAASAQSYPKECRIKYVLQNLALELDKSISRDDKSMVTLVLEEQSGENQVCIDEEKVVRVLRNLFHNALDNTESGYIKFGYKQKDNRVVFYVLDSGESYNKNRELINCQNIGNYLVKHKNTFTTVGFVLAQQLVSSMGGKLWIESNGVSGSAIYFSVPESTAEDNKQATTDIIRTRIAI